MLMHARAFFGHVIAGDGGDGLRMHFLDTSSRVTGDVVFLLLALFWTRLIAGDGGDGLLAPRAPRSRRVLSQLSPSISVSVSVYFLLRPRACMLRSHRG